MRVGCSSSSFTRLYTRFGPEIDGKKKTTFHRRKWKINSKVDARLESELVEKIIHVQRRIKKLHSGYE